MLNERLDGGDQGLEAVWVEGVRACRAPMRQDPAANHQRLLSDRALVRRVG